MEKINKEVLEWNNLKCPKCGVNCDYFVLDEVRVFFAHKDSKCKWVWEIKDEMLTESDLSDVEDFEEEEDD